MDPLDSLRRAADRIEPDPDALARVRERLLHRAAGVADARPARRPSRRALLVGAAAVVAAAGVGGSVVLSPRRAAASGLTVAAAQVTDPRLGAGQWLRVTTLLDDLGASDRLERSVQTAWIPQDRLDVWTQRTVGPDGAVHVERQRLGQLSSTMDYEAVELVIRTPGGFRSLVPDWADMRDPRFSCVGVQWAQTLLSSGEVPAPQRAQLYRYLADLPGVRDLGSTRLATGRTGTVFAADDHWRRGRWDVVIDTATGEYLGDRFWGTGDVAPHRPVLVRARALATAIVDSAPA